VTLFPSGRAEKCFQKFLPENQRHLGKDKNSKTSLKKCGAEDSSGPSNKSLKKECGVDLTEPVMDLKEQNMKWKSCRPGKG
jgi:hypothetical protein